MRSTFTGIAGAYRFTLLAGAATALALPSVAFAQDEGDEPEVPEADNVIIVTASKREQTLQETPIAVSVTSGETIERAQIRDVLDLQTVVPSLRVSQLQTSSATTFIIRGFGNGDNNFGIEPSVGVFIDGVFRSRSAAALSDLNMIQRVEVLNGPQSTLFGKNASAGVISVVTKEPEYQFGGQIEASYGNYNAVNLRGEVTGPITDNIAWSLDGTYQRRDGFGRIVNLDNAEINDRNRWSVRGNLLIEPTADIKIRLIADYTNIDEVCCQTSNLVVGPITQLAVGGVGGQFPTDFFSFDNYLNAVPFNKNENYGFSGQLDWAFGNINLTSITAYRELTNAFTQDVDFTSADITAETRDQAVDTFTQELRLTSDFDGPINFLLGGYYFDESISQDSSLSIGSDFRDFAAIQIAAASAPPGTPPAALIAAGNGVLQGVETAFGLPVGSILGGTALTRERFGLDNQSWSVFGTVDFEPLDGLVFTAGFNYTDDRKDFTINYDALDPLANINLVDAFITQATGGAVTTRAQFQALPSANQQALLAAATNPAVNPLLGLTALQFQPPSPDVPNAVEDGRTRDDQLTYLFRVAYQASNELNVYASYSTGFKASSVNLSRDSRPLSTDYIPGPGPRGSTFGAPSSPIIDAGLATPNLSTGTRFAGPEEARVIEVGMKGQWEGWGFNLAVFDQEIEGFQSFLFTGLGFGLANAGKQSVRGFELDTTIQPVDPLVLTFAVTHLDPLYDDFTGGPLGDLSGRRPAGIPAWSLRTSATYSHEFGSSNNFLITRVDYAHDSQVNILDGITGFNANQFRREVNLVNASMTLSLDNGLEIGAFARNLLDEQYALTIFPSVAQAGTVSGYPNPPRTYGGLVRFKF
ncbi:TonB-dependent receptor [Porphyrobacter sp. YT40]|uniref:TonB-dependent receptor n=1 Tax=Porphyrobacter sp. YT40 TaxID=2547601 RepID=UPI001141D397|nr:TonB-dependent receptor [Porphyrobacter sp. YT40]QDH34365.1 TonB-dependent receptor [Porphyrobacter sp. YT40]